MRRRILITLILLLVAATTTYSVVNAAQSTLPDQIERGVCSALIASFCGAYGNNVCNAIVPQDCGAMQSSAASTQNTHQHGIFFFLNVLLFGTALALVLRKSFYKQFRFGKYLVRRFFLPHAASPPLLVGRLSSLRF